MIRDGEAELLALQVLLLWWWRVVVVKCCYGGVALMAVLVLQAAIAQFALED